MVDSFVCCGYVCVVLLFFFFKQKTAYEMRISDWSSDVCSSDLMPLNLISDFGGGGMLIAFGILAALHERSQSGKGQVVDAAMVEGCLTLLASTFGYLASGFHTLDRGTNLLDGGVPYYGVFETARSEEHTSELQSLMRISYA